jgi:PEP-CTERM motif
VPAFRHLLAENRQTIRPERENVMSRYVVSVLALSTFLALPQVSDATPISLVFSFNNIVDPISADYVGLYSRDTITSDLNVVGVAALAPIPVGDSTQSIVISPAALSQTVPPNANDTAAIAGIAFIGVYNPTSTPGLTIGIDSSVVGNYLGKTYAEAFPLSTITESAAVTGILGATIDTLGTVPVIPSSEEIGFPIGDIGEFVNFSTGTVNGSFTESVVPAAVPEPSTITLFGAGLFFLSFFCRRPWIGRTPQMATPRA